MSPRSIETEFDRAQSVVRRAAVSAQIDAAIRTSNGGRPRRLSVELLLAAAITSVNSHYRAATLVTIHRILTVDLPAARRRRERLTWDDATGTHTITLRQVRYLFKQIVRVMDFSPHTTTLNEDERIDTEEQTLTWLNALVRASVPASLPAPTASAIDASAIPTWARPKGKITSKLTNDGNYLLDRSGWAQQRSASFDPDARYGHRTKTQDSPTSVFFGHMLIASATSYTPGTPEQGLKLIEAIAMIPNGAYQSAPTLNLIDRFLAPHNPNLTLLIDRGFSNLVPENWARELHRRAIPQHLDMTNNDLNPRQDPATGAIMFAGTPYVPWTPMGLFNIDRPTRFTQAPLAPNASPKKQRSHARERARIDKFEEQIAALERFALSPNGRRKPNGDQRYLVPHQDRAMARPAQRRTKVFRQTTVTLTSNALEKLHQPHRWGTRPWIETYSRRTAVEGVFGALKSRTGQGMSRGWTRVVGITATALMTTMAVVQHNIQMIRSWTTKQKLDDATLYAQPANTDAATNGTHTTEHEPGAPPTD